MSLVRARHSLLRSCLLRKCVFLTPFFKSKPRPKWGCRVLSIVSENGNLIIFCWFAQLPFWLCISQDFKTVTFLSFMKVTVTLSGLCSYLLCWHAILCLENTLKWLSHLFLLFFFYFFLNGPCAVSKNESLFQALAPSCNILCAFGLHTGTPCVWPHSVRQ